MARRFNTAKSSGDRIVHTHGLETFVSSHQKPESLIEKILEWDCRMSAAVSIAGRPRTVGIRWMTAGLKVLEITGHGIPWLIGAALFAYRSTGYTQIFSVNLLIALLLDLLVVGVTKVVSRRQRPVYNRDDMFATVSVDKYSFPSGHATRAVLLAILFMYVDLQWGYTLSIATWAFMIAVSRVILGRHHVLDVAAGVAIGSFEAWFMFLFVWLDEDSVRTILSEIYYWLVKHNFPFF